MLTCRRLVPRGNLFKALLVILFTVFFILVSHQSRLSEIDTPPPPTARSIQKTRKDDIEIDEQGIPHETRARRYRINNTSTSFINGEKYPKLNGNGKFIPQRRIVHIDLKGAPFKVEYFTELFFFLNRIRATGILLEWEDMFPYTGKMATAVNGKAYTMEEVRTILKEAKKHHLEIIPLVQTFGHLEWILKLKEFAHLREDNRFPQVICFPEPEAWKLITDMVDQVAAVHKEFGMSYFHLGADEAFQVGYCNASMKELANQGGSISRLVLWHISRTARYIKEKHETTVLGWHDMLVNSMDSDIRHYELSELLQPVLWSYAEDLDLYLPRSTWYSLRRFPRVWGSSAFKGADGPARYNSNPMHYIRNHESWIEQFTENYQEFDVIEGIVITGWSRYDHFAILCELMPVALPTLAMSMETLLEGRPLLGVYGSSSETLACDLQTDEPYTRGCRFPASRIYELVNELFVKNKQLHKYMDEDFELNGWLSRVTDEYAFTSPWYIDKVLPLLEFHAKPLLRLEKDLRDALSKIFFQDTVDEFIFTYMSRELTWIRQKLDVAKRIQVQPKPIFLKRPFVKQDL